MNLCRSQSSPIAGLMVKVDGKGFEFPNFLFDYTSLIRMG